MDNLHAKIDIITQMSLPPAHTPQSQRMILLAHSCLWIFGGIISYPREP